MVRCTRASQVPEGNIFLIPFVAELETDNHRIIAFYFPDPDEWEEDLKTRRHSS